MSIDQPACKLCRRGRQYISNGNRLPPGVDTMADKLLSLCLSLCLGLCVLGFRSTPVFPTIIRILLRVVSYQQRLVTIASTILLNPAFASCLLPCSLTGRLHVPSKIQSVLFSTYWTYAHAQRLPMSIHVSMNKGLLFPWS